MINLTEKEIFINSITNNNHRHWSDRLTFALSFFAAFCLGAAILMWSMPYFYAASLLFVFLLVLKRISLIRIFISVWMLLFINFFFGLLVYKVVGEKADAIAYALCWIASFVFGYFFINATLVVRAQKEISMRLLIALKYLGFVGALLWVAGGVIYSYEFLSNLDFAGLRLYYVRGLGYVPMLSSIGSVLTGACFFIIARLTYKGSFEGQRVSKAALVLLLLIPLFMAGRQLYLQVILYVFIGAIYSQSLKRQALDIRPAVVKNNFDIIVLIVFATILLVAMTIMRFSGGDEILYQTKLTLFSRTSSVELNSEFLGIYNIFPPALQDVFVEFSYYFGSQLGKFIEIFNTANTPIFGFDLFNKSAFMVNNLNKILVFMGVGIYSAPSVSIPEGYISSAAWGTAMGSNMNLLGYMGALVLQFIFGAVCATSQVAFENNRQSYVAYNFVIANAVVIFYGVMDSIFNEIYFLFYYVISLVLFILSSKFYFRISTNKY